eukprot:12762832-Alexandrium_andersonii.AAC.1
MVSPGEVTSDPHWLSIPSADGAPGLLRDAAQTLGRDLRPALPIKEIGHGRSTPAPERTIDV